MTETTEVAGTRAPAPASLSDGVYQRLRSAIVRGDLRPNERLVEADLAGWLEVSRTPVRECLQRLAAERLVANRRRGWIVQEHSTQEIREIYDVRAPQGLRRVQPGIPRHRRRVVRQYTAGGGDPAQPGVLLQLPDRSRLHRGGGG